MITLARWVGDGESPEKSLALSPQVLEGKATLSGEKQGLWVAGVALLDS